MAEQHRQEALAFKEDFDGETRCLHLCDLSEN